MDEEDEVLDYALTKDILKDALRHFFPNEPDFDWDIKHKNGVFKFSVPEKLKQSQKDEIYAKWRINND